MADDLWRHALDTLDHYKEPDGNPDISFLYEYEEEDTTGILKRHKKLVNNVTSEPKVMYFELIKMLMDWEKKHSNQEAYTEIQSISKIQGYQDLTNRLLRNINERLFTDLEAVTRKLANVEKIIGIGNEDNFAFDEQPWVEKLANIDDRLKGVEGENNQQREDIANLYDIHRAKDDDDEKERSMHEEQAVLQAKALEVLEKRIDANEEHIDLLEKHDSDQDEKIEDLTEGWSTVENKLPTLESDIKMNAEKIEELNQNDDTMKAKIENMEKEEADRDRGVADKSNGLEEEIKKLENEVKGNSSKIEDGNVIIKRHSEQLYLVEPMAQDTLEAVKEIEDKLTNFQKEHVDQDQKILSIENDLSNKQVILDELQTDNEKISSKLEDVEENTKFNLRKIQGIEEQQQGELEEKATYVGQLESKVVTISEQAQQSEAKLKDDLDQTVEESKNKLDELKALIDTQYQELSGKTDNHADQIGELWNNNKKVEEGLRTLTESDEDIHQKIDVIGKGKDELARELEKTIDDQRNSVETLQEHVNKLKEATNQVEGRVDQLEPIVKDQESAIVRIDLGLESIPEQIDSLQHELNQKSEAQQEAHIQLKNEKEKEMTNFEEKLQGVRESLSEIDKDNIDDLIKANHDLDAKMKDIENRIQDSQDVVQNTLNVSVLEIKSDNEKALETLETKMDTNLKGLVSELEDELKTAKVAFDAFKSTYDEQTITQEKSMEELGNRIDANQDHIEDLQEHDTDQDAKIEDLTEAWSGMENKLTALESADTYIQESHKLAVQKVQVVEDEGKSYRDQVVNLKEDLESYQENKDLNDEKTIGILEILKENEKKLTIDVEELNKDSAEIKERLEELDEKTKKLDDKAESLVEEVEKAKEIIKNFEADQTDGIGSANEKLAMFDEMLKNVSSDLHEMKEQSNNAADEIKSLHNENESQKLELKSMEDDAATFQEKVYITLNDNRDKTDETAERMSGLIDDIKGNAEKIEALDKNNNMLNVKIENIEKEEENRGKGMSDKSIELEQELKKIENEVKGNSSKIEDGNVIIKRHSEQLYLIEPMAQDTSEAVTELEDKLKDIEKQNTDHEQKILLIETGVNNTQSAIDNLQNDKQTLASKLDDVDENTKFNLRKIQGLEEQHQGELEEKATYVGLLESKVVTISEQAQQNEAKLKDDLDQTVEENKSKLDELQVMLDAQYQELVGKTNTHTEQIEGLRNDNKKVEEGLSKLSENDDNIRQKIGFIEKQKDELARDIERAADETQNSLDTLQKHFHKVDEERKNLEDKLDSMEPSLKEHGLAIFRMDEQLRSIPEDLRNVKADIQQENEAQKGELCQLMNSQETNMAAMEEKMQAVQETLNEIDKDDIDELVKDKKHFGEKIKELEERINEINDVADNTVNVSILEIKNENEKALEELESKLDLNIKRLAGELEEELKTAKENVETAESTLEASIEGVKSDSSKAIEDLEAKMNDAVLDLYNKELNGIKEDIDSIKGQAKQNESELDNVSNLVQNVQINIGEVKTQCQEEDNATNKQIRELRKLHHFFIY